MVNRKTVVANQETEFDFNINGEAIFTVKNFTDDYILVSCNCFDETKAYKIPSMTAQNIKAYTNKLFIKAVEGGEVEIDALH